MTEHGNAHDSGDCLPGCPHPDHVYDGVDAFDLEDLLELREMAGTLAAFVDDLDWDDDEGPVSL